MALRRNVFHLFLYGLSTVTTQGLTYFVLIPTGTRYLSTDEYGAVEALQAYSAILVIFFSFYLSSAYTRQYYEVRDDRSQLARLTSTILVLLVAMGALLAAPAYWAGRYYLQGMQVEPGRYTLILAVLLPLINMLMALANVGTAYLNQVKRNVAINVVSVIGAVLSTLVGLIGIVYFDVREEAFFAATLIINVLSAAYCLYALYRESLLVWAFDWRLLKPCLVFAVGTLPFSVCGFIWNLSDRIVLGVYEGVELLGKYALAYKVAMLLQLLYNQFWKVANPYLLSWLAEHREEDERDLHRLIALYTYMLGFGGLFLIYFGPALLRFMAPQQYQLDPDILTLCVLAIVLLGVRKCCDSILWYHRKLMSMFLLVGLLPALLNLVGNIIFIPMFREYAAAWSTLGTAIVVLIISIRVNSRLDRIPHVPRITFGMIWMMGAGLVACLGIRRFAADAWSMPVQSAALAAVFIALLAIGVRRLGGLAAIRKEMALGALARENRPAPGGGPSSD
ncbi:MAG TPA: oligosaccharide flippase family protein [Phycisphaerae bacterium]|nr:oligosaccharide flippase family protein [Phycisphaerae bacterium]HRW55691.1 oligosaccharide flippase family protein [Phycisphaerae bacterium]